MRGKKEEKGGKIISPCMQCAGWVKVYIYVYNMGRRGCPSRDKSTEFCVCGVVECVLEKDDPPGRFNGSSIDRTQETIVTFISTD